MINFFKRFRAWLGLYFSDLDLEKFEALESKPRRLPLRHEARVFNVRHHQRPIF
jgi:hypothetical protein